MATRQGGALPPGCALDSRGPPVRQLMPFFCCKKANFTRKIWAKDSPQSELQISRNIRNGEREESGNAETKRQRDRSNLGGALAPPVPWRPWTRGETLLPSREEVKEKEEGGRLSPLRFRWHPTGGHHHHRNLHQQLHRHHHQLFPPLCSGVTSLSYPL